jgi:hypothetical protein
LVLSVAVLVRIAQKAPSTASISTGAPTAGQAIGRAPLISGQSSPQAREVSHNAASRSILHIPNQEGD